MRKYMLTWSSTSRAGPEPGLVPPHRAAPGPSSTRRGDQVKRIGRTRKTPHPGPLPQGEGDRNCALEIFGAFGCNRGCLKAAAITTTIKHISTRVASHALPMNLKMPPLIISDLRILRFMGAMREKNRGILSWRRGPGRGRTRMTESIL